MTQFHEGQEVEVAIGIQGIGDPPSMAWRKAKIVNFLVWTDRYEVEFADGTHGLFAESDIRKIER